MRAAFDDCTVRGALPLPTPQGLWDRQLRYMPVTDIQIILGSRRERETTEERLGKKERMAKKEGRERKFL